MLDLFSVFVVYRNIKIIIHVSTRLFIVETHTYFSPVFYEANVRMFLLELFLRISPARSIRI